MSLLGRNWSNETGPASAFIPDTNLAIHNVVGIWRALLIKDNLRAPVKIAMRPSTQRQPSVSPRNPPTIGPKVGLNDIGVRRSLLG